MNQKILPRDRDILSLIMDLSKAVRCCRQDEVFCEDVTFTQFMILDTIARNSILNMASLHDTLSVDKSTTTRLVAPLIRMGLVIRDRSDRDSRAATLKLTLQGKETHYKVWQCLLSFTRLVHSQIPEEKRDAVLESVRIFLGAMQKVTAMRCSGDVETGQCRCATEV
jgi:DNA-binding MarR family transcriptional regulator